MADFVAVENIKDALAECPICTDYFNDTSRIPRRMPCCLQVVCEPCLETCSQGRRTISCPLCRQHHNLPGGVKSLQKEKLILRFLNVLKTQSNAVPSCTDCPDNNTAMARCDTCSIYLCQPCLAAHSRNRISRNHKTITFEEIKSLRSTRSRFSQNFSELNVKLGIITQRIDGLSAVLQNIDSSRKTALDHIKKCFDDLIAELQQRRGILLSEAEANAEKENKVVTRAIESHKSLQHKLQEGMKEHLSPAVMKSLMDDSPEDVDYERRGINFLNTNTQEATAIIRAVGLVRTITFTPLDRPDYIDETSPCHAIAIDYSSTTKAPGVYLKEATNHEVNECSILDQVLLLKKKPVFCPHVEFDRSTASDSVVPSGSALTNTGPVYRPQNTGCNMRSSGSVLLSKPFILRDNQCQMFMVKINLRVKQNIPLGQFCWGITSTARPVDLNGTQMDGFSIDLGSCQIHNEHRHQICLMIANKDDLVSCEPLLLNRTGASREMQIAVLLDSKGKSVHVLDAANAAHLASVPDVVFDQPLWSLMYFGGPVTTKTEAEILSGNKISVSRDVVDLLNTLLPPAQNC